MRTLLASVTLAAFAGGCGSAPWSLTLTEDLVLETDDGAVQAPITLAVEGAALRGVQRQSKRNESEAFPVPAVQAELRVLDSDGATLGFAGADDSGQDHRDWMTACTEADGRCTLDLSIEGEADAAGPVEVTLEVRIFGRGPEAEPDEFALVAGA